MVTQIIDKRTVGIPGPAGAVTPQMIAERDAAIAAREAAEDARDQAEVFSATTVALQQAAVAGVVNTPGAGQDAVSGLVTTVGARTFPRAPGVPIDTFLTPSEIDANVLGSNGVNAEDVYFQRAYNNVARVAGRPNPFYVGPGIHRLNTGVKATTARRDVCMVGAGPGRTHIRLGPAAKAVWEGYGDSRLATPTFFENLLFEGWSFDGWEQVASPNESMKGIILGHVRDTIFRNLSGYGTHATMYGVDFQTRCYWEHVYGEDAGRGINTEKATGFGATFGFGFGATVDESVFMSHVGSKRAARPFVNLEWLVDYGADLGFFDGFVSIDGFDSLEDGSGFQALGVGLVLSHGRIRRAKVAGGIIGNGGQSIMGGRNVVIDRSVLIEDTQNAYPERKWLDVQGGHGIVLRGQSGGGAVIEPTIKKTAGSPVYIEPGWLLTPSDRGIVIAPHATEGDGAGLSYVNGGRMEKGVKIGGFWGHNQDRALDIRSATIGMQIDATFSCDSKQTTVLRVDPNAPTRDLVARGVAYNAGTLIENAGSLVNPHTDQLLNVTVPTVDPSRFYFGPLVTERESPFPSDVWSAVTPDVNGVFTSTAAWFTDRDGARPYDGGTGNSGITGQKMSAGQIGYLVTATIAPTETDYGRLGIMVCYSDNGDHVRLENYSGAGDSYQLVRYVGGVRSTMATFGSVKRNERHQVGIYVSATGNTYRASIDNEWATDPINTSTLAKTAIVGVTAGAQLKGRIRNFKVQLMA